MLIGYTQERTTSILTAINILKSPNDKKKKKVYSVLGNPLLINLNAVTHTPNPGAPCLVPANTVYISQHSEVPQGRQTFSNVLCSLYTVFQGTCFKKLSSLEQRGTYPWVSLLTSELTVLSQ